MTRVLSRIVGMISKVGAALTFAAFMTPAQAAIVYFWYLDNGVWKVVATVTTSGSTDFQVDFNFAPASPGVAKINGLYLDGLSSGTFSNLGGDTAPDATGCLAGPGCSNQGTNAEWVIQWPLGGSDQFDEGETSKFRISPNSVSSWSLGNDSLHINAFLAGDSIKLDGCLAGGDCTPPGACEPGDTSCTPPTVPEPGTLALLGVGMAGLALIRRRKRV